MLAGALALAGCGGSSNNDMDDGMTEMSAEEKAKAEAATAKRKQEEAEKRAEEAEQESARAVARAMFDAIRDRGHVSSSKETAEAKADDDNMHMAGYEAATSKPFAEVYSTLTDGALVFTNAMKMDNKEAKASSLPINSGTRTYASHGDKIFEGTYDGAAGTFTCTTSSDCTATAGDDGVTFTGDWMFKPKAGAMVAVKDTSAVMFGWWSDVDDPRVDRLGARQSIGVFSYGKQDAIDTTHAGTVELSGSAKYTGDSVGLYALNNPLDASVAETGSFTADAELSANFGNPTDEFAHINGTIKNFMTDDGMEQSWTVKLNGAMADVDNDTNTPDTPVWDAMGGTTVWSIDGIQSEVLRARDQFSAQLYNSGDDGVPSLVGGTYRASWDSLGMMVGSFGAERSDNK